MAPDLETTVFVLHIATIATLYLFLFLAALLIWRDVQEQGQQSRTPTAAHLTVIDGGTTDLAVGQRLPVSVATTLGRLADNVVPLPDASVSATHAIITWRSGHWWIEDQASLNGTVLNEAVIDKATLLCSGDVITLGRVQLRFET